MQSLISHSCLVKRDHVAADELDNGIRLYLNFGHTIGHAIEGQRVMTGCCMEAAGNGAAVTELEECF